MPGEFEQLSDRFLSPHSPTTLYAGANKVLKSTNRGENLIPISPDLTTNDPEKQKQESSGGVTVLQILKQLERFDLAALGPNDPRAWHLFAESTRLAFADRDRLARDDGPIHQQIHDALVVGDEHVGRAGRDPLEPFDADADAAREAAIAAAFDRIAAVHASLSRFDATSEIGRFNAAASGASGSCSPS